MAIVWSLRTGHISSGWLDPEYISWGKEDKVHELVLVTSKFPLKRLSNGGVMLLKAKPFFEGLQRSG